MSNDNVYKIMQESIIKKLEEGIVPWRKTWAGGIGPRNAISNKPYRGFNILWLSCQGHSSPYWLTFKQCKQLKGNIKKGAESTMILFWKVFEKQDKNGGEEDTIKIPMCRYYRVWNIDQTEGIELNHPEITPRFNNDPIQNCEDIMEGFTDAPPILYGNPAYGKGKDTVYMPNLNDFVGSAEYYAALFHEMSHSTMHPTRLNRNSENYAKEELIAEMSACFLCAVAGIETQVIDNQSSYLSYWLERVREDASLMVLAAGQAQKSADYILNHTFDENGQLILPPAE